MGRVHKEEFGLIWLQRGCNTVKKWREQINAKIANPTNLDNRIYTGLLVVCMRNMLSYGFQKNFEVKVFFLQNPASGCQVAEG